MTVEKKERVRRGGRRKPQVRSISTLWLIAVAAIVFCTGWFVNLI